ncbi:hypothetical protein EDD66_103385 [Mobilisporobacter senegalensis]|uniref:Vacuolar-type H+-ATPase subunit H n=1 Tax=Mobilisporobacter senegalensis TaxID=1329262 RepID=A0A3N1XWZ0_9FIRM|nr:ATPase [Mobilisporobacter senegalensis]ROR29447.1 hypothetical protein EDD66_103385 [Mobilisporobacter senegalensis]
MSTSKIEQLIEDIYEFVESCKMQPLSSTKVIVPKDELYDLLDELRLRTPDEIKRYQKIIANRDAIINDAQEQAATILADARERTNALIDEHEIMQQAYYQANSVIEQANEEANRILQSANNDANQIRTGALRYTEEMLSEVEKVLSNAYESTRTKSEKLVDSLKDNLDIVVNNKKELCDQLYSSSNEKDAEVQAATTSNQEQGEENSNDDFEFDENTFIEDLY